MRHRLRRRRRRWSYRHCQQRLALAPTATTRGVLETPRPAALIAPSGLAQGLPARHRGTARGAVNLASITVAANENRLTAARAQEASGRNIAHEHLVELPRVCWTESSTGVTLVPHPLLHDTV
jgi:hypothetical protein